MFNFLFSLFVQNPEWPSLLFLAFCQEYEMEGALECRHCFFCPFVIFINGWTEWANHYIVIFNPPSGHLPLTTNKENAPYSASSAFLITNQLSLVDMTPIMKGTSVVNVSSLISSQRLKWKEWASHSVLEAGKQGLQEFRSSKKECLQIFKFMMIQIFCLMLTLKWRKLSYIREMDPVIKGRLFVSLVRLVSRVWWCRVVLSSCWLPSILLPASPPPTPPPPPSTPAPSPPPPPAPSPPPPLPPLPTSASWPSHSALQGEGLHPSAKCRHSHHSSIFVDVWWKLSCS